MKELQQLNLYQTFPRLSSISSLAYINIQRIPIYIGVFVEDNMTAYKQTKAIRPWGIEIVVRVSLRTEPSHLPRSQQLRTNLQAPNDNYHLTTFCVGGNNKKLTPKQTKQYNSFKSDQKALLKIDFIIYIPEYIICPYCPDTDGVEVDNRFSHVTLYMGSGAKTMVRNIVIESMKQKNPELFFKKITLKPPSFTQILISLKLPM